MRRGTVAALVLAIAPATGLAQTTDGSCDGGIADALSSVVGVLSGIFSPAPGGRPAAPRGGPLAGARDGTASQRELVQHWAPTFYQDTDDSFVEGDYITRMDFDGDWQRDNNWDNLSPASDLRAYNYYSAVETGTHAYLLYADFHPRDWEEHCNPLPGITGDGCHENDLEGAMVVIRKDGSRYGKFELLATQAHGKLHLYRNDPRVTPKKEGVVVEDGVSFDGTHPELFSEAKGHGVYSLASRESRDFPGGDGVIYRPGTKAERPSNENTDVEYELLSIEETFWKRRSNTCDDGCTFDKPFRYGNATLGGAFDGGDHSDDSANPPWQWRSYGSRSGDFFFRPAETISSWVNLPGPVSTTYTSNPYLDAVTGSRAPGG